jgi:predicted ATP-grasp superfamily ATP-dependent carboligase
MGNSAAAVLLTDAQERSAPSACESLSRAGYRVGGASSERPAPGQWSRFCNERFDLPDPRADSRKFALAVSGIAQAGRFDTIMPGSDAALIAISAHRDLFPAEIELGLPAEEVVDACVSKVSLMSCAVDAGLAAPETAVCANREEALAAAARLGYPVLLKPRRSVFTEDGDIHQRTSFLACDEAALAGELSAFGLPCLLQRHFSGALISIGGVAAAGQLPGLAVSRYIRTWPPRAGSVSCSETISAPADLLDRVGRFVAATGWEGVFELELIEGEGGEFAAIDFNPRLYGSLALAVSAGASLPAIWCDWLLRDRLERSVARPGVRYRWGDADLQHVGVLLRDGHLASAAGVLRPRRGTARPYLRPRDPAPALARALQILRMVRRRLLGA